MQQIEEAGQYIENFPWNILIECIPTVVEVIGSYLKKSEENCPKSVSTHMQQIEEAGQYIENFPWNILIECIPTVVEVIGSFLKKSEENGAVKDFVETMIRGIVYGWLHPSEENGWWSKLKKFAKKAVSVVKDVAGTVKDVAGGVKDVISIFKEEENFPFWIIPTAVSILGSFLKKDEENFPFWIIPTAVSILGSFLKKEENCSKLEALGQAYSTPAGYDQIKDLENFPFWLLSLVPTVIDLFKEENCGKSKHAQQIEEAGRILDSLENGWWSKLKKFAKKAVSVVKDVAPIAKEVISIFKEEENCSSGQSKYDKLDQELHDAGVPGW